MTFSFRTSQIIEAASMAKVVLMDFKPENVIRVVKGGQVNLKAIDFDGSCAEGTDMLSDATCVQLSRGG
jgi:hypothetical protein